MSYFYARFTASFQFSGLTVELCIILILALCLRLITYNGAFGSDDLVYFERAAQLARGEWTNSNYNGALRYGFNLPAAGFIFLLGPSLFAANLWSLICSLVEIAAIFLFANSAMNRYAARFSALLLASAPLHMSVATRIHADPVVSMFVTVSFVFLYFGFLRLNPTLLLFSGLAIGGIFWSKELAAVTWFSMLPMVWFYRSQWRYFAYVFLAVAFMMLSHGILMWLIADDPLHLLRVVLSAMKHNFIDNGDGEDSATYYLKYLFLDLRHIGFLAFMAVASIYFVPPWLRSRGRPSTSFLFILFWWFALLLVLSLFPVSLFPLRLAMKQSNYISLFLAPTAALAGMFVATLPRRLGYLTLVSSFLVGTLLGALQQADYRAFTANSKALSFFSASHPGAIIVGSTNNSVLGTLWSEQSYPGKNTANFLSFRDLKEHEARSSEKLQAADSIFAALDPQTLHWFSGPHPITSPLPCWGSHISIMPIELGMGNRVAKIALTALTPFTRFVNILSPLAYPKPLEIYKIPGTNVLCDK